MVVFGNLPIATYGGGVGKMETASGRFESVSPSSSHPSSWREKMPSFLELPRAANCESRSLVGERDGKIIVVPLRCGSWGCVRCAARMTTVWACRVAEAKPERMVTFTRIGENRDEIRFGFQQVIRDLRKQGFRFEYWGVVELHKSGVPHMHVVQRGDFVPKTALASATHKVNWGWSDIRAVTHGWSAARYCAKHLCHSHGRRWGGRLIRYSRRFFEKDVAQADLKDASKDEMWSAVFGRADAIAEKYRKLGYEVEAGDLGVDWILNEPKVGEEVIRLYARDLKKGYAFDSPAYSEVTGERAPLVKKPKFQRQPREVADKNDPEF